MMMMRILPSFFRLSANSLATLKSDTLDGGGFENTGWKQALLGAKMGWMPKVLTDYQTRSFGVGGDRSPPGEGERSFRDNMCDAWHLATNPENSERREMVWSDVIECVCWMGKLLTMCRAKGFRFRVLVTWNVGAGGRNDKLSWPTTAHVLLSGFDRFAILLLT